ncbi:MAG: UDP-3-O-acyl-N-acetylglucosamine deacetylase [Planctomycetaceae bacterium]
MTMRPQQTISRVVTVQGVGFLTGADVTVRFHPAPEHAGITFQRVDLPGTSAIPALVEYVPARQRRTALTLGGATVELVEHVLAALAGLQIDNCRIELDACELPGLDGSSQAFADALLRAGLVELDAPRRVVRLRHPVSVAEPGQEVRGVPSDKPGLTLSYSLDYGDGSPIPRQSFEVRLTPEAFLNEVVYARTFVLEQEVAALQAQGYGRRTTAADLLIYGTEGVVGNTLRSENECARHKLLDCVGDFALLGCDLSGRIEAHRSGHSLNSRFVRQVCLSHPAESRPMPEQRAA